MLCATVSVVTVMVPSVKVMRNTKIAACRGCARCNACRYWWVSAPADVAFALRLATCVPSFVTRVASSGGSSTPYPFANPHSSTLCRNDQLGTISVHHNSTFDVGSVGGNFAFNHLRIAARSYVYPVCTNTTGSVNSSCVMTHFRCSGGSSLGPAIVFFTAAMNVPTNANCPSPSPVAMTTSRSAPSPRAALHLRVATSRSTRERGDSARV